MIWQKTFIYGAHCKISPLERTLFLFGGRNKIWLWGLIRNIFLRIMHYSNFVSISKAMRNRCWKLGHIFENHQFFKFFNKKIFRMVEIYLNITFECFFCWFFALFREILKNIQIYALTSMACNSYVLMNIGLNFSLEFTESHILSHWFIKFHKKVKWIPSIFIGCPLRSVFIIACGGDLDGSDTSPL